MMKGSGLEEALETVHGPNAVVHMISGKAVSRALRSHFLVEAALVNKLMLAVLPCQVEGNDDGENLTPEIHLQSTSLMLVKYRKSMFCMNEFKMNL